MLVNVVIFEKILHVDEEDWNLHGLCQHLINDISSLILQVCGIELNIKYFESHGWAFWTDNY